MTVEMWAAELAHTTAMSFETAAAEVKATLAAANLALDDLKRLVQINRHDPLVTLRLIQSGAVACLDLRLDEPLCRIYPATIRRCAELTGANR